MDICQIDIQLTMHILIYNNITKVKFKKNKFFKNPDCAKHFIIYNNLVIYIVKCKSSNVYVRRKNRYFFERK